VDEEDHIDKLVPAKMLREHHCMAHLPFSWMRAMAQAGVLPAAFATCREPVCSSCLYGKATCCPWQMRGKASLGGLKKASYAGQCLTVDQSESPAPGLVAQLKGIPTKKQYTCATVFVDLYLDFSFVHFQYSTNAQETLEAKQAFERFAKSHGVDIRAYHMDNGRFVEKLWLEDAYKKGQQVTYAGVNTRIQNGRGEKKVRDLQDMGRTQLIHAHWQWLDAICSYFYGRMQCKQPTPYLMPRPFQKTSNLLWKCLLGSQ